jgi:hypothetical protein
MSMFSRYFFIAAMSLCAHQSCMPMQFNRVRTPKTKPQKVRAPKAAQPTYSTRLKSLANWFRGYSTSTKESAPKAPKASSSFESQAYTATAQPTGSWYGWFTNLFKQPATIEIPKEVYVKPPTIEQKFIAEPTERPTVEANQEPVAEPEQGFADTMQEFIWGKSDYRIKDYDDNDKNRAFYISNILADYHFKELNLSKNELNDILTLFKHIGKDRDPIYKYTYKSSAFQVIAESGIGKEDKRFKTLYRDVIDQQSSPETFYHDAKNVIMGITNKGSPFTNKEGSYKNDLNANEYALNLYKKLNPQEKMKLFPHIRQNIANDNSTFKNLYRLLTINDFTALDAASTDAASARKETEPKNYEELINNLYTVDTILRYDGEKPDALNFAYKLLKTTIRQYKNLLTKLKPHWATDMNINSEFERIKNFAEHEVILSKFVDLINKSFYTQQYNEQSQQTYYAGNAFEDAYKVLGLESNASFEAVKAKTKALQKQHHPDYVRGKYNDLISKEPDPMRKKMLGIERDEKEFEANETLKKINDAYDIIKASQPSNL